VLNALMHEIDIHKGSQWAVFVATVHYVCVIKGLDYMPSSM